MAMNNFNKAASTYDADFTYSVTGNAQRKIIHYYLQKRCREGLSVLEINCGTGEDAFFLASLRCKVLATDGSAEMIRVCLQKAANNALAGNPAFSRKSFSELRDLEPEGPFDFCFSDFSGLNCIDPEGIMKLSGDLYSMMKPEGKMILVLFGTRCIWEKLYMILKGRFGEINRRSYNASSILNRNFVNGLTVYYYKPSRIINLFSLHFEYLRSRPVGLYLPPSYLENFFRTKPLLMRLLAFKESLFGKFSFLSDFADHYLIEFRRR